MMSLRNPDRNSGSGHHVPIPRSRRNTAWSPALSCLLLLYLTALPDFRILNAFKIRHKCRCVKSILDKYVIGVQMKTTIGERLRTARENKEMDQASLAAKAGIVTRTLQRWEKGEQVPDGVAITRLARGHKRTGELAAHRRRGDVPGAVAAGECVQRCPAATGGALRPLTCPLFLQCLQERWRRFSIPIMWMTMLPWTT